MSQVNISANQSPMNISLVGVVALHLKGTRAKEREGKEEREAEVAREVTGCAGLGFLVG